ncbi:MAG: response regulator transcription factor [Armatimonadetes bacterium]|nr:response regulator transcription factor [Armatimonadota bacterium]
MPKIRLLIAEDETLVRYALAELLNAEPDLEVVGEAPNGEAAVVAARDRQPDVVLMDINMPKLDGIEATRQILQELPQCAVVMLTVLDGDDSVFEAVKAGAKGYVLKHASAEELLAAVRAAARGEGFLGPTLVGRVLDEFARISRLRAAAKEVFAELTRRELEVLELLSRGMRNREIAGALYLSEKTVKNHISSVLAKLHVNDRTEAALLAAKHGLADPPGPKR